MDEEACVMTDIAVIILQKNEALHIKRCLERLAPLEPKQVFVVDCFSADGSDKIAEESGAAVVKHEWPGTQARQFNWAIDNLGIDTEWILRLDADEYLTDKSINWLKDNVDGLANTVCALEFTLERRFMGGEIRHGTNSIAMVRMFRTGNGRYSDSLMDERIVFNGSKLKVPVVFYDDNLNDFEWWKSKHKGYAKREALQAVSNTSTDVRKVGYYKLPRYLRVVLYFCYRYFLRRGFLDGVAGFRWHFWQGFWYRWLVDREIGALHAQGSGVRSHGAEVRSQDLGVRVLHVIPSLRQEDGGPATSVPHTAMAQVFVGMKVGIAYFGASDLTDAALEAEKYGVNMHPFKGSHSRWNRVKFSLDFMLHFGRTIKEYDLVVTHLNWMLPIWWATHVARVLHKPYIMMPRGCISPNAMKNGTWKKSLVGPLDRYAIRRAAAVWTTSPMEANWVRKYVKEAKVDILPMGLNTSLYSISREKPAGDRILLFMSRISAIKALDMLAEAWKEVWKSGWRLVIVGPDDRGYLGRMKRLYAQTCPEGSYEFRDAMYGEEKAKILREATAFVLPSRSENWSVSISEAMASGLPVICTKGAPWGVIPEIGAGWQTEISTEGLKGALIEMMAKSDEELHEMGLRGMKWVQDNLDWKSVGVTMKEKMEVIARG